MRWLLIGYMFLFIDRPFEVWPWLGDLHVERVYMLLHDRRVGGLPQQAVAAQPAARRLCRASRSRC